MAGDELPGQVDGALLEVVTYGEVAKHLEEGKVALVPDLIQVGRAKALLNRCQAGVGRGGLTCKIWLELAHPRTREKQGRVTQEDEGGAADDGVGRPGEIIEEGLADLASSGGGHGSSRGDRGILGPAPHACQQMGLTEGFGWHRIRIPEARGDTLVRDSRPSRWCRAGSARE